MQVRHVSRLLEDRKEYTYEQAFRLYDEAAKLACIEDNKAIKARNIEAQRKIDNENAIIYQNTEARNQQEKERVDRTNAQLLELFNEKNKKIEKERNIKVAIWAAIFWSPMLIVLAKDFDLASILMATATFAVYFLFFRFIANLFSKASKLSSPELKVYTPEQPRLKVAHLESLEEYTFIPSGVVQCSSCATKTRLDNKTKDSKCPNCGSEIFVVSQMEDNVTIKSIART